MSRKVEALAATTGPSKEEADLRSVYVGNVHFACTSDELSQHFQGCGPITRVTIPSDQFGQPKGYAYIEFTQKDSVAMALLLNETTVRGRQIKVIQKRTNVPGMARGGGRAGAGSGRRRFGGSTGGYMPYGMGMMPYMPMAAWGMGMGVGYTPRWRGAGRAVGRGAAASTPSGPGNGPS